VVELHVRTRFAAALAAGAALAGGVAFAQTPDEDYSDTLERFRASLGGLQENPSISTRADGRFRASVRGARIQWELRYDGIEGGAVQQAHIHFARPHVNGGISVWLCGNIPTTPAGVQPCPQEGTISGVIQGANVVGPAGQGIGAGQLNEVIRAMRRGATYANVHSATFPGGEIRGQIRPRG
jgi:hypothetical protein